MLNIEVRIKVDWRTGGTTYLGATEDGTGRGLMFEGIPGNYLGRIIFCFQQKGFVYIPENAYLSDSTADSYILNLHFYKESSFDTYLSRLVDSICAYDDLEDIVRMMVKALPELGYERDRFLSDEEELVKLLRLIREWPYEDV